jgi:hypothetical protein
MRVAATIVALLGTLAIVYGSLLAAFLVGGFSSESHLVAYLFYAGLIIGVAGAIAVWWRPKAAAASLGLAALEWLAFFILVVVAAPTRPNDVPAARLNMLAVLVCVVPMLTLLLGAFFAARAKVGSSLS